MNQVDEPEVVLDSFYKHQDEITRQTESQARYVAKAIDAAAFLASGCREGQQLAIVEAAAYIVNGVWHNRVVCGLADGADFDQFWQLVIDKYAPRVDHMRLCRSTTRRQAFVIEFKPKNTAEVFRFHVEP